MTAEQACSPSSGGDPGYDLTSPADSVYARGINSLEKGDLNRALDEFGEILKAEPGHAMATYKIGTIAREIEDFERSDRFFGEAIPLLKHATIDGRGTKENWFALLDALGALLRRDEMRAMAEAAIARQPSDLRFQRQVAIRLLDYDVFDVPLSILQGCLDRGLDDSETHSNLAVALCNLGRENEAISALNHAIEIDPENGAHYEMLARIYRRDNLTADKAVAALRRGLEVAPSQSIYADLAGSLATCGQYEEAVQVLRAGCADKKVGEPGIGLLITLSKALSNAGHEQSANQVREHILGKLALFREVDYTLVRCLEIDLLWSLGRRDEALEMYRELCGGNGPETFAYHPDQYSPDIPARLDRLRRVIGQRDVFILLHGPSVKDLEDRIKEFAGRDICFMTGHSFALFESALLSTIERKVELVMVTNSLCMSRHVDQVQAYLERTTNNMLLTGRHCFDLCTAEDVDSATIEQKFDDKLLMFPTPGSFAVPTPTTPLSFPIGNTLACMLPFLVLGEAKRIFLFGADGVSRDAADGHLRYGTGHPDYRRDPIGNREGRMVAMNLLTDTLTFDHVAELSIQGASLLFDLPVPPIYNVSPRSHLGLFPKIDIDECIALMDA